ncbi:SDR family NAD(P)-dependent oxidoreductase [Chloroflexota bacterium]
MSKSSVILITGASSGIGAATARLFAKEGYRVVLAARRISRIEDLAEDIRSSGNQAFAVGSDVSNLEDINNLVLSALDVYGRIDILFNNAGFGRIDWLENLAPGDEIQSQIQVNLTGLILLTQAVLPHMIERRSGHIINMSSLAGLLAMPTYSVYAASKFAVRGFSEALRREVAVYGINVSVIYPGAVDTEFEERAHIQRKTGTRTPKALRLSADEVAQAVLHLTRRPKRSLVIPWQMCIVFGINRFMPGLVDWLTERYFVIPERLGNHEK